VKLLISRARTVKYTSNCRTSGEITAKPAMRFRHQMSAQTERLRAALASLLSRCVQRACVRVELVVGREPGSFIAVRQAGARYLSTLCDALQRHWHIRHRHRAVLEGCPTAGWSVRLGRCSRSGPMVCLALRTLPQVDTLVLPRMYSLTM
jgi:hypothetical protein